MPPWVSFQGRETGEWKRDFCGFNRTIDRLRPPSFFLFLDWSKNIFCVPLGLLHNGDYASSYSRNVSIPASHQNTDVPCQGKGLQSIRTRSPGDNVKACSVAASRLLKIQRRSRSAALVGGLFAKRLRASGHSGGGLAGVARGDAPSFCPILCVAEAMWRLLCWWGPGVCSLTHTHTHHGADEDLLHETWAHWAALRRAQPVWVQSKTTISANANYKALSEANKKIQEKREGKVQTGDKWSHRSWAQCSPSSSSSIFSTSSITPTHQRLSLSYPINEASLPPLQREEVGSGWDVMSVPLHRHSWELQPERPNT